MLLPPKDLPSLDGLLKHIAEKGATSLEMVHLRKGGGEMKVKVYFKLVKTAHGQFIVFVVAKAFPPISRLQNGNVPLKLSLPIRSASKGD